MAKVLSHLEEFPIAIDHISLPCSRTPIESSPVPHGCFAPFTNLESLTVDGSISETTLCKLLDQLPALTSLNVIDCPNLTPKYLYSLPTTLCQLHLRVRDGFYKLEHVEHLQSLPITFLRLFNALPKNGFEDFGEFLCRTLPRLVQLEELQIASFGTRSDQADTQLMFSNLTNLRKLTTTHRLAVTWNLFTHLEELALRVKSTIHTSAKGLTFPNLRSLELHGEASDGELPDAPNLHTLILGLTRYTNLSRLNDYKHLSTLRLTGKEDFEPDHELGLEGLELTFLWLEFPTIPQRVLESMPSSLKMLSLTNVVHSGVQLEPIIARLTALDTLQLWHTDPTLGCASDTINALVAALSPQLTKLVCLDIFSDSIQCLLDGPTLPLRELYVSDATVEQGK